MNRNNQVEKDGICITEDQLLLYVKGLMPISEQKVIELHITQCDLCNDATEGIRLIKNNNYAYELLATLRKKINKNLNPSLKYKSFISPVWHIAAILFILLLSAGGYFVIKQAAENKKNELANLPNSRQSEGNEIVGRYTISENIKPLPGAQAKHVEGTASPKVNEQKESNTIHPSSASALSEKKELKIATNDEVKSVENRISNKTSNLPGMPQNATTERMPNATSVSLVRKTKTEPFLIGKQLVDEQKFDLALPYFMSENNRFESYYFAGMCYYQLKQFGSSIVKLDQYLASGSIIYYEDALWLKANSLIHLKEKKSAKLILEKIISINGKHKINADKLLIKL